MFILHLTVEKPAFSVGTFDIKASRIQECGSVDMSKYGHSQTAKIKSKHPRFSNRVCFCFFFLLIDLQVLTELEQLKCRFYTVIFLDLQ